MAAPKLIAMMLTIMHWSSVTSFSFVGSVGSVLRHARPLYEPAAPPASATCGSQRCRTLEMLEPSSSGRKKVGGACAHAAPASRRARLARRASRRAAKRAAAARAALRRARLAAPARARARAPRAPRGAAARRSS